MSRPRQLLIATLVLALAGPGLATTASAQTSGYTSTVPTAPTVTPTMPSTSTSTSSPSTTTQASGAAGADDTAQKAAASPAKTGKLAFTGFDVLPLLLAGVALMMLGGALALRPRDDR